MGDNDPKPPDGGNENEPASERTVQSPYDRGREALGRLNALLMENAARRTGRVLNPELRTDDDRDESRSEELDRDQFHRLQDRADTLERLLDLEPDVLRAVDNYEEKRREEAEEPFFRGKWVQRSPYFSPLTLELELLYGFDPVADYVYKALNPPDWTVRNGSSVIEDSAEYLTAHVLEHRDIRALMSYEERVEESERAVRADGDQAGVDPETGSLARAAAAEAATLLEQEQQEEPATDSAPPGTPSRTRPIRRIVTIAVGATIAIAATVVGASILGGGSDSTGGEAPAVVAPSAEESDTGQGRSDNAPADAGAGDGRESSDASGGSGSSDAIGEAGDGNEARSLAAFLAAGLPAPPLAAGTTKDNVYTDTAPIPPDEVNFSVRVHLMEDGAVAFTLEGDPELLLNSSWKFASFDGNPMSEALITGNTDISIFTNQELSNADPENVLRFGDASVVETDEVPAGTVIGLVLTEINIESDLTTIFIDGFAPTDSDGTALVGIVFQEVRRLEELGRLPYINSLFKTDQDRPSLMVLVEPGLVLPGNDD